MVELPLNIKVISKGISDMVRPRSATKMLSFFTRLFNVFKREKNTENRPKPKLFAKLMKEISMLFDNLIIFDAALTAVILFLISSLVLMLFSLPLKYSFVLPLIYIATYLFFKLRENKYLKVEKRFPNLNEKLRTAVDNIYAENDIVNELRNEIYHDIKQVDYASFFKEKRTSYKILLIIFLCFGILFMAQFNLNLKLDFDRMMGFIKGGDGNTTGIISDIISATVKGPDSDIYGEESLAKLGNDKLTIQINKVGYEVNVNDIKDPTKQDFEESLFPEDIGIEKAEVYTKNILRENQEIVKNYFKNMAQNK
jgi:hypothetical protein